MLTIRSSARSAASSPTSAIFSFSSILTATWTRSRTIVSTSRPTYPTSVNLVASTLMKGASASRARRRAISVLPTPVGPIIRMFLGVISCRRGSATCWRRQRFLRAIATARFARIWPTMCLSSSWTISWGVMEDMGGGQGAGGPVILRDPGAAGALVQRFDDDLLIGVDAQVRGDRKGLANDSLRVELGVFEERARGRLRVGASRSDRDQSQLGLDDVAHPGDDQRGFAVGHGEHRLQASQHPVGAPVLGELHGRAKQISLVLFELRLEALEQRKRVGRASGEAGEDAVVIKAPHLARARFHHDLAERDLAVPTQGDFPIAASRHNGGSVELFHARILGRWGRGAVDQAICAQ